MDKGESLGGLDPAEKQDLMKQVQFLYQALQGSESSPFNAMDSLEKYGDR